ncbi:hypothetical protein RM780_08035 [Streptomyces sp. DSM 44917]|uniref:Uncharacterized protein n=1 Tax=Streptomyces boetiae TaxID=3075541 RepID=A0ABU2L5Y6_9ACTN|nr:hypothetical protein [Streptomyces sp. DSM 44917]MDT0306912.1 hypothetical protein [Streptomyces sp. DSM 44917]
MTEIEWVPRFDYPPQEWVLVDVRLPDGPERAAQQVADRGGRQNKRYAKAVYSELRHIWKDTYEELGEPVVAYVPHVRRNAEPLVPTSVAAFWREVPCERTLEALMEAMSQPLTNPALTRVGEPEVSAVELPVGPACRVHDVHLGHTGWEQLAMERLEYWVLSPLYPAELLQLKATWVSGTVGEGMAKLVDRMAASLTCVRRGEGEEPRPVLDAPGSAVIFDEVQIGKGLRPLAQHGFVTLDRGVLSLLGSDRQVIASAPVSEVTAWPVRASLSTAVGLEIGGTTYNAAPGRGSYPAAFTLPTDLMRGHSAPDQLFALIEQGGGKRR